MPNRQLKRASRRYGAIQDEISFTVDIDMLQKIDTTYTTSRYPADFGLIPEGKPSLELAEQLYEFATYTFERTVEMMEA